MGMIATLLGKGNGVAAVGEAVRDVAEVFTTSATRQMELSAAAQQDALKELAGEFDLPATGWFDRAVNGLNRLPRPLLAFGSIGLFVFAMTDPPAFAQRMEGLNRVPEPLWWLMGAVVAFYFGARETHYFRGRPATAGEAAQIPTPVTTPVTAPERAGTPADGNAALEDWRAGQE